MKDWLFWLMCAVVACIGVFLFSIPARSLEAEILVCNVDTHVCTAQTARFFKVVPIDSGLPMQCLESAMKYLSSQESGQQVYKDEFVRVTCLNK